MTTRRKFIKQSSAIVAGGLLVGDIFSACRSGNPLEDIQTAEAFGNPPLSARPGVFWDWLNGNISRAGITRDLEAMKSKGIMRAEIWDVRANQNTQMIPAGKSFLGDESVELIRHAIAEGKRLKMRIGIIASSGWNAGGSWVTPDRAAKGLYFSELKVEGPAKISVGLPFPNLPKNCPRNEDGTPVFHREVAVFAVPDTDGRHIEDIGQTVNLTKHFVNGQLEWDAPAGKWTVLRFVCSNTGQMLVVPSPESNGLFIDFLDPEATRRHLQYFMDRLGVTPGNAAESGLDYFEFDSMELDHGIVWTDDMPGIFQKSQGYSIENWLPLLAGWKMKGIEDKVRYDFRKTVSDQLIFSHYHTGTEFLKKYGAELVAEAGGPGPPIWNTCPVDALKALGNVSVPRGEFWIRHRNMFLIKEVSSAAHIYGKKTVDAESLTTWRRWKDSPFDVKKYIDRAYGEGLNCITFHTFAHTTPEDGLPGRTYHAGFDINPSVTWWEKSKPFLDYISRCNYMLQQGLFVADVCYYYGDQAPNFFPAYHSVPERPRLEGLDKGYDYDVVNSDVILNRMSVENGRIVLPDGMSYTLLMLPEQEEMPLSVLRKLDALAAKGATVIGAKPARMPGLNNSEDDRKKFDSLTAKLWDGGKIISSVMPGEILLKLGKDKDFDCEHSLDYIHRTSDIGDIYFVYNESGQTVKTEVRFRVTGRHPELWDPADGSQTKITNHKETNGYTHFPIELAPYGSVFVVFNKQKRDLPQAETTEGFARQELKGSWKVNFPEGWGAPQEVVFDELKSWTDFEDAGIKYFSGTAAYSKTFTLDSGEAGKKYYIDLGEVRDLAEVFVNGKSAGILWKKPFCADISGLVRSGDNELKVEIVNLWVNRLTGDMLSDPENRYCSTNHPYMTNGMGGDEPYREQPSGLLGPVELKIYK
ncbi:MAG: hypothetical protein LBK58_12910 [Prevotellaceae bacterium]|jgi:hypothetical protein|nr:hypothetical protein [Prevotellaceae bacterium]